MAAFPDLLTGVQPNVPGFDTELQFVTLLSEFENSNYLAKRKNLFPKRNFKISYNNISTANAHILYQFYIARSGMYEKFSFFDTLVKSYTNEYVGTGDGSTTVYNLPSLLAANNTLSVGGVGMDSGTDYTFEASAGADGCDKLTMAVPPQNGAILLWSFTGRLKVRCRFGEDSLSFSRFMERLVSTGIILKGMLNDA